MVKRHHHYRHYYHHHLTQQHVDDDDSLTHREHGLFAGVEIDAGGTSTNERLEIDRLTLLSGKTVDEETFGAQNGSAEHGTRWMMKIFSSLTRRTE